MRKLLLYIAFLFALTPVTAQQKVDTDSLRVGYFGRRVLSEAQIIGERQMNNKDQATSALDAIRGRVAGLQVEKGGANAMSAVRLRGTTSLTGGNDPLIIVDGVMGGISLLESVYPTDIQSFAILKGSSETAQYGSRGSAGVIEVKTLRGKSGRTRVSYNGSIGISSVYKRLEMLSGDGYRDYCRQRGLNIVDLGYNTNFQREIEQTGLTHQHHVAFAGGGEQSNYRVSVGYQNEQTVIKGMGTGTFMANMNMTQYVWDGFLRVDLGMFGSTQKKKDIYDKHKLFYSAASFNPTFPNHRNDKGQWDKYPSASQISNPLSLLEINNHTEDVHLATHTKLEFRLLPVLKLTLFGSYTYTNSELRRYLPTSVWSGGQATRQTVQEKVLLGNAKLRFEKTWDRHKLGATLLGETQASKTRAYGVQVTDFASNETGFDNLQAGALRPWEGTTSVYANPKMVSLMGQVGYTYNGRYGVNMSLRGDASSKFGDNHKWGYFPAFSASWNLGREPFVMKLGFIDELRFNAGIGWSGNQSGIDNYTSLSLLHPNGITVQGERYNVSFAQLKNVNPFLKWEVTRTFDLGLDAQMFHGRLVFNISYYHTKTTDMLYPYPVSVPPFTFPTLVANLGSMRNNGLEVSVGGTPLATKDMELTINTNFSFRESKLLSLSGNYHGLDLHVPENVGIASLDGAGLHDHASVTFQSIGQPLGVFRMQHSDGLAYINGQAHYLASGENVYCGQAMPKVLMGSNISFRYHNVDVSIQANGAFGHKIFNGTSLTYMDISSLPFYNVLAEAADYNIADKMISDYWLEPGDYVNIDYITVGWSVPLKRRKIIESMRLSLTMNNVATFTSYSGLTPIINSLNKNSTLGLDDKRTYPLYHTYTLGVTMNF